MCYNWLYLFHNMTVHNISIIFKTCDIVLTHKRDYSIFYYLNNF